LEVAVSELIDDVRTALTAAGQTVRGNKALHGHDEDFELEIAGYGSIYIGIAGGRTVIERGPSPRREALHFSLIQMDEATLRAILEGRMRPVEAMEAGSLFLRTRLYGGGLITILLRAAYDVARERKLEVA
jgi:hypothetical protein